MSIIYDALKKLEKNLEQKEEAKEKKRLIPLFLILFISLLFFYFYLRIEQNNLNQIKPNLSKTIEKTWQTPPSHYKTKILSQKEYPEFVLNGIFYSEDEAYAVINNQILRVNDRIKGFRLKSINSDEVELENEESQTIKLSIK